MIVAKLSTDKIVQLLKPAQEVAFAVGEQVLVCDRLTTNLRRIDPYWVPARTVMWQLDFADKN